MRVVNRQPLAWGGAPPPPPRGARGFFSGRSVRRATSRTPGGGAERVALVLKGHEALPQRRSGAAME